MKTVYVRNKNGDFLREINDVVDINWADVDGGIKSCIIYTNNTDVKSPFKRKLDTVFHNVKYLVIEVVNE